jgi:hypothetical protein
MARRIMTANGLTQTAHLFSGQEYRAVFRALARFEALIPTQMPSTGACALARILALWPEAVVELAGFGFAGAPCHPWAQERALVEHLAAEGRLHLLPL